MQTTLLGLAIGLILALLAAIVGPYFIDWSRFRPQFEAEASRISGLPVQVKGTLDARLLPTPSLTLHGVSLQLPSQPNAVGVDRLDVTFSLGSLMRGEWRADEMAISGLALDLGLDDRGRFDWPASSAFNLASLTIDRLSVSGKIALSDQSSAAKVLHLDGSDLRGRRRTALPRRFAARDNSVLAMAGFLSGFRQTVPQMGVDKDCILASMSSIAPPLNSMGL